MHERNHVLGTVGRDAQQDVGAKHVKQENQINEAGKVEHLINGFIPYANKKNEICPVC